MEKKCVKRSANWDQDEKDLLSNLVLDKLDIIENSRIDTNTNKKKKEAWSTVTELFNKVSKNVRSMDQVQAQWRKSKSAAKSKNSLFMRQRNQTGGGPAPEPLTSIEEQLVSRLPSHFEIDSNIYDSNSQNITPSLEKMENTMCYISSESEVIELSPSKMRDNSITEHTKVDNLIEFEPETPKPKVLKRKKDDKCEENLKRIKLLDISIEQKKLEMECTKKEFDEKKKLLELQKLQMQEEHELKKENIKFEIHNLKKNWLFYINCNCFHVENRMWPKPHFSHF